MYLFALICFQSYLCSSRFLKLTIPNKGVPADSYVVCRLIGRELGIGFQRGLDWCVGKLKT